jgi:hypothetical protein
MKWLDLLIKYGPAALQLIVGVQAAIGKLPGPVKEKVVLSQLQAEQPVAEENISALKKMIATFVADLKEGGAEHFDPSASAPK